MNSSPSSGAPSPFGSAQEKGPLVSPQTSRSVSDLVIVTNTFLVNARLYFFEKTLFETSNFIYIGLLHGNTGGFVYANV